MNEYVIRVLKKEKTRLEEKFDLGLSDFAALTYEKQIKELQQAIDILQGKVIASGIMKGHYWDCSDIGGESMWRIVNKILKYRNKKIRIRVDLLQIDE